MRLLRTCVLLGMLVSGSSMVSAAGLSPEKLAQLPASVQKVIAYNDRVINNGGKGLQLFSFEDTEYRFAIAKVVKKIDIEPVHIMTVNPSETGLSIAFQVSADCGVSDRITDQIIRVDDVNIATAMGCGKQGDDITKVFIVKSDAGRAYIKKRFTQNEFVFVDLGTGEVPFKTDGFSVVWDRANQKIL